MKDLRHIICPSCKSEYEIENNLINKERNVRCNVCSHIWQERAEIEREPLMHEFTIPAPNRINNKKKPKTLFWPIFIFLLFNAMFFVLYFLKDLTIDKTIAHYINILLK